jgi:hypothetical protein
VARLAQRRAAVAPVAALIAAPIIALVCVAGVAFRARAPAPDPMTPVARAAATPAPEPPPPHEAEIAALRALEDRRRATTDMAAVPPSDIALGPDPYRIAALPGGDGYAGVLRGESAVVLIDRDGVERARIAAPGSPSGLAVSPGGDVLVVGETAREIGHYRRRGDRLERIARLPIDALGLRAIAIAPDARTAYVAEEREGRVLAVSLARTGRDGPLRATGVREVTRCHGPIQVAAIAGAVAVDCLLDHAIEIHRDRGEPVRIVHDGPIWSFDLLRQVDGGIVVAAGGIEDHPLVREDGGFGYIDSYVFLYRLAPDAAQPVRIAAINSSELGAVTPKWIAIREVADGALAVTTAGYASSTVITATWPRAAITGAPARSEPAITRRELVPGIAAAALAGDGGIAAADPLLDAWVIDRGAGLRVIPVAGAQPARPLPSRIGELVFFTTLMAPWNSSDGKLSRFTCEACHHEGYIDGRVHFTGRSTVHAATRPLLGLGNLRPLFSRAMDPTMADMVHAEFRVANRHNGRDPWFAVRRADVPWLDRIAGAPAELSPQLLRESLMAFLADFTHRRNPAAVGGARFTPIERAGAIAFRDRCASCHEARLVSDDPASRIAFERWESLVLSPAGPIVWSNAAYAKTGVEPYVHDDGARVAPLRRMYKKWPYFTNGSARSLGDVFDRFAWTAAAAYHDAAPADATHLTAADKAALRAFVGLL